MSRKGVPTAFIYLHPNEQKTHEKDANCWFHLFQFGNQTKEAKMTGIVTTNLSLCQGYLDNKCIHKNNRRPQQEN
jgi:hypothetical protein